MQLTLNRLSGMPLVQPGDDLAELIAAALPASGIALAAGDVVVVAQKIVSKAEGRLVRLASVEPGERARQLATTAGKDARIVELMLRESTEIVAVAPGVIITRSRHGIVQASAGIDSSNVCGETDDPCVLLLPENPDLSAAALREALYSRFGVELAVIINDSAGRPWRTGVTGFAIGTAGFEALESRIGEPDLFDQPLQITEVAVADELAAAASFLMGQGNEGTPVVVIRGAGLRPSQAGSASLIRAPERDLFRSHASGNASS